MANNNIGGVAYIKVDGNQYSSKGTFTVVAGEFKREAMSDSSGNVVYTEKPILSKVSGNLYNTAELDIEAIQSTNDATVTIELNNGKVFVLLNAVYTGDPSLNTETGEFDIEFHGKGRWQ